MKYSPLTKAFKRLMSAGRNTNNGHFDVYLRTNAKDAGKIELLRQGRDVDCSQQANFKGGASNAGFHPVAVMFIPLYYWGSKLTEEEIAEIVFNLKEWLNFGRACFFRAKFKGVMTPQEYYDSEGFKFKANNTLGNGKSLILEWDCNDLCASKHGLGTFTFFRYFYSGYSGHIYRTTMRIKNQYPNLPERVCLWAAHMLEQNTDYDPYYGLYDMPTTRDGARDEYGDGPNTLWGIPNSFTLQGRYNQGVNLNVVWSKPIQGLIQHKLELEEYKRIHGKKVSPALWKSLVKWGSNVTTLMQGANGDKFPLVDFFKVLTAEDGKNNLENFLSPYLSCLYEPHT